MTKSTCAVISISTALVRRQSRKENSKRPRWGEVVIHHGNSESCRDFLDSFQVKFERYDDDGVDGAVIATSGLVATLSGRLKRGFIE